VTGLQRLLQVILTTVEVTGSRAHFFLGQGSFTPVPVDMHPMGQGGVATIPTIPHTDAGLRVAALERFDVGLDVVHDVSFKG
jgi:hypothetical protein